ncbi:hypothetical protein [Alloactinosynnema sp. L-07]|uniref:hypothetical protein n=1 Tax=Alloactinosynnema sp. L-07 TaxID=1653480 RepID=UPI00065EFA72|nr:hypothetical protein [Alloactinosynnema sp. L-07]CRK57700.1 hypothetical protein [Alloactinosynnema sp. L-07]
MPYRTPVLAPDLIVRAHWTTAASRRPSWVLRWAERGPIRASENTDAHLRALFEDFTAELRALDGSEVGVDWTLGE